MKLHSLQPGQQAVITRVELAGPEGARLYALGFVPGSVVTAVRCAPMGDPVEYAVRGIRVALRQRESLGIAISEATP